ncbi:MAG: hypothetical protein AAF623_10845 [Planctomycetota bacterium]
MLLFMFLAPIVPLTYQLWIHRAHISVLQPSGLNLEHFLSVLQSSNFLFVSFFVITFTCLAGSLCFACHDSIRVNKICYFYPRQNDAISHYTRKRVGPFFFITFSILATVVFLVAHRFDFGINQILIGLMFGMLTAMYFVALAVLAKHRFTIRPNEGLHCLILIGLFFGQFLVTGLLLSASEGQTESFFDRLEPIEQERLAISYLSLNPILWTLNIAWLWIQGYPIPAIVFTFLIGVVVADAVRKYLELQDYRAVNLSDYDEGESNALVDSTPEFSPDVAATLGMSEVMQESNGSNQSDSRSGKRKQPDFESLIKQRVDWLAGKPTTRWEQLLYFLIPKSEWVRLQANGVIFFNHKVQKQLFGNSVSSCFQLLKRSSQWNQLNRQFKECKASVVDLLSDYQDLPIWRRIPTKFAIGILLMLFPVFVLIGIALILLVCSLPFWFMTILVMNSLSDPFSIEARNNGAIVCVLILLIPVGFCVPLLGRHFNSRQYPCNPTSFLKIFVPVALRNFCIVIPVYALAVMGYADFYELTSYQSIVFSLRSLLIACTAFTMVYLGQLCYRDSAIQGDSPVNLVSLATVSLNLVLGFSIVIATLFETVSPELVSQLLTGVDQWMLRFQFEIAAMALIVWNVVNIVWVTVLASQSDR